LETVKVQCPHCDEYIEFGCHERYFEDDPYILDSMPIEMAKYLDGNILTCEHCEKRVTFHSIVKCWVT